MKQILLLLENKINSRLLLELLQQNYQAYQYQDESSLNLPFDLCIVDGLALKRWQRQVQVRRKSEEPILLPFLLLTSRPDVGMVTDDLRHTVDEVIITPIEKMELLLRVEVLLRTRHFSAELANSNRELEEFAHIASHDLQEPLRQIKSYTDLLVKRYRNRLDQRADQYINYITDSVVRMQKLIIDLLTYSQTSRGELILETTDLGAILNQVLVDLSSLIEESQAVIRAEFLPTLKANPSQMGQLLQNLITNAIKFRNRQSPLIQIKVIRNDQFWTISVQDNGIGIEPQYAERIFLIFQRLHTREEYPGTGIGLAICKKIVQHHGGRIWLESEPGQGSIFFFTMPAT
ncbi:MAG: GHKL domain-containing protein [Symploca sp. SIO2E9]|nr:GHKL domain-containing protein [Symploca sp. SIO2E9]